MDIPEQAWWKKPTIAASLPCFSHALSMDLQKIHVIPQLVIGFKIKRACSGVTVEPLEMAEWTCFNESLTLWKKIGIEAFFQGLNNGVILVLGPCISQSIFLQS